MTESAYLTSVRAQYEDLPYPLRNPEDERKRLLSPLSACLDRITHWGFGGKRDLRDGCRVLIAGGGTGDGLIFFAEQLRGYDAEIVYVDISKASLDIAQKRAAVRKLDNIRFIHDSLLNIPKLGLGEFDYIDCSGVLHHLASPDVGMKALADVLKDDGIVCLMLYGLYGRTAVYQMQSLARIITNPNDSREKKLELTRKTIASLPADHWLNKSRQNAKNVAVTDDNEIYDLFLHSQDRAYTVPDIYDLVEGAGLQLVHLFASHEPQGNFLYDPRAYARDPELLKRLLTLDVRKQQAAAELMNGQILKHNFYARRTPVKKPLPQDDQWLPFCWMMYTEDTAYKGLSDAVAKVEVGKEVVFREDDSKGVVSFIKNPLSQAVVDVLDGKNTIRDILKRVQAKHPSASRNQIGDAFVSIYSALHLHNWMLLRDPKIKPFLSATELQKRFLAMHP